MKTWFFTEDAYPYLPDAAEYESIRVNLPNRHYDPVKGTDLYHMYLDMWLAAEDHGLEIMVNEHHQTATCVVPAAPLMLAILARQSKTARLLILGNPLPNRNQPVRVAEEMAMIDVISRGRLECGFVRSVPWEASAANITAYRGVDRLWEAHDLILKAWTTHDGPFNFEGRYYRHRQVNIWPRPFQQPHPPIWVTIGSAGSAVPVAERDYIGAVFLAGYMNVRKIFDGYRAAYLRRHGRPAGPPGSISVCGAGLCGGNGSQGARGRREESLVHALEQGHPAPLEPARLPRAGCGGELHEGCGLGGPAQSLARGSDGARQRLRRHTRPGL
jgi:Luciferase-like monooxygenase